MTIGAVNQSTSDLVGSTQSATSTPAQATSAASKTLNYNDFLKLLMAEIKNQDPLSPVDTTQSVSQMATFSQVEQQVNANSKLDSIVSQLKIDQAASLVGKTVSDGTVSGSVVSVAIGDTGNTATLENGKTITIGPGVTIS